jgi:flagellin
MSSSALKITNLSVSSFSSAGTTMQAVQKAIDTVSTQRSALGAIQNRLEHTINNLDTSAENTQSAESRIRDTDMASEMVQYSATSIIQQAGQSMLAQANSQTQGVLSLIQ